MQPLNDNGAIPLCKEVVMGRKWIIKPERYNKKPQTGFITTTYIMLLLQAWKLQQQSKVDSNLTV